MFIIYFEPGSGRITQAHSGPMPANVPPGLVAVEMGVDPMRFYMPGGVNKPRPLLFDGAVSFDVAAGEVLRIHEDLPPAEITFEGPVSGAVRHEERGPLDIAFPMRGAYRLFVEAFPYQMAVVLVVVS